MEPSRTNKRTTLHLLPLAHRFPPGSRSKGSPKTHLQSPSSPWDSNRLNLHGMVAKHNCELNVWENSAWNVENNDQQHDFNDRSQQKKTTGKAWSGLIWITLQTSGKISIYCWWFTVAKARSQGAWGKDDVAFSWSLGISWYDNCARIATHTLAFHGLLTSAFPILCRFSQHCTIRMFPKQFRCFPLHLHWIFGYITAPTHGEGAQTYHEVLEDLALVDRAMTVWCYDLLWDDSSHGNKAKPAKGFKTKRRNHMKSI